MMRSERAEETELLTVTTTTTAGATIALGEGSRVAGSRLSALEMRSRFLDPPPSPPLAREDSALATIHESVPAHWDQEDPHTYDHPPYDPAAREYSG